MRYDVREMIPRFVRPQNLVDKIINDIEALKVICLKVRKTKLKSFLDLSHERIKSMTKYEMNIKTKKGKKN